MFETKPVPYVIAVLLMSALGIFAVILITVTRPDKDNTLLIASVFGFLTPTTISLLSFMKSSETHTAVNGRLDAFIEQAQQSALAAGASVGRRAAEERADTLQLADERRAQVQHAADLAEQRRDDEILGRGKAG